MIEADKEVVCGDILSEVNNAQLQIHAHLELLYRC